MRKWKSEIPACGRQANFETCSPGPCQGQSLTGSGIRNKLKIIISFIINQVFGVLDFKL